MEEEKKVPEAQPQPEKKKAKKYPYRTRKQCDPWYKIIYPVAFLIFRFIWGLKVYGRENIPEGPAVICPRHCSTADPPLVCFALTRKIRPRIIAKIQLFEIPVVGWALTKIGMFPVRRGENDMSPIKNGLRCLKEGEKLIIFPEGTRVKEGEHVQAQTGAIMFALKTGVPLVPVYLTRAERFKTVKLVFGEPYMPQIAGKRPTPEEYRQLADELLEKIYALESRIA